MTSVNTHPQNPYTAGYVQPQSPEPVRQESSAEASGHPVPHANVAPPRPPVTPEQRGQFSSHNAIVNPRQPQGTDTAGELAELTQKNQTLAAKYKALAERFSQKITELSTKIETLIQQLSTPGEQTEEKPAAPEPKPQSRIAGGQAAPPETPPTPEVQGNEGTEHVEPQGFKTVSEQITRLQYAFNQLLENFNAAMKILTEKLDTLTQLLSKGAPQSQVTPEQPGITETVTSNDVSPETTAPAKDEKSAPASNPVAPAPGTVEYLKQENQKLESHIDQMTAYFEQTMAALEQQFETLTRQANERKK